MIYPHNTALLIIDQQQGLDHPKLGPRNNPTAEANMLQLLNTWRQAAMPIFHIRHRSNEPTSVFWPEQIGFAFKPEFIPQAHEPIVDKNITCALLASGLATTLKQQNTKNLVLVGAATHNSIESTVRTGSHLGFNITIIENACYTFAQKDYFGTPRSAQDVHAMSLASLQGEFAQVLSAQEVLSAMKRE